MRQNLAWFIRFPWRSFRFSSCFCSFSFPGLFIIPAHLSLTSFLPAGNVSDVATSTGLSECSRYSKFTVVRKDLRYLDWRLIKTMRWHASCWRQREVVQSKLRKTSILAAILHFWKFNLIHTVSHQVLSNPQERHAWVGTWFRIARSGSL